MRIFGRTITYAACKNNLLAIYRFLDDAVKAAIVALIFDSRGRYHGDGICLLRKFANTCLIINRFMLFSTICAIIRTLLLMLAI